MADALDVPREGHDFLWVVDFPLFHWDADRKAYAAEHQPFTQPDEDDIDRLESDPLSVGSHTYDFVMDLPEGTDVETVAARVTLAEVDLPEKIRDNLALFLRLVRKVLEEYDPSLRSAFDALLTDAIAANADDGEETQDESEAFVRLVSSIDEMPVDEATIIMRAFVAYFHLANVCEENYRVSSLRVREHDVPVKAEEDPINDMGQGIGARKRQVCVSGPASSR